MRVDLAAEVSVCYPAQLHEHIIYIISHISRLPMFIQVLSSSVANALQLTKEEEVEETMKFVANFDKFFDSLNVSSLSAGKLKRNPFKSPYRSATDFRLKVCHYYMSNCSNNYDSVCIQWLEEEFIPYLDNWERSVQEREGFSNAQKLTMLLSAETRLGLRLTGKDYYYACTYKMK